MKTCMICPHRCNIKEGHVGLCRARINKKGIITAKNYGVVTAMALDPVEKKPLKRFYPGAMILSVGSYGCNLKCPFCQNSDISMTNGEDGHFKTILPKELLKKAQDLKKHGNIGIAYTYNEPLVGYEFVYDCSKLAFNQGLKNVVVTNGYICKEPLLELLPYIHAMNIDLKAFNQEFYKRIGGDLETVKNTIALAARKCHVEVTALIIPGENDCYDEMRALSKWLALINKDIALHITRFFPRFNMLDKSATPVDTIFDLAKIAKEKLNYVYVGNI